MRKNKLRPYLKQDSRELYRVFRSSIEELAADDYSEEQRIAWIASITGTEALHEKLSACLTLIIENEEHLLGFISLRQNEIIDMLYVAPLFSRQGIATSLCEAVEQLAHSRGTTRLTTESSDVAEPFFLQRDYKPIQRNAVLKGDLWLGNTTMQKDLTQNRLLENTYE